MMRLTWLQFRAQSAVVGAALAALAILLLVTGLRVAHAYDTLIAPCAAQGNCDTATNAFMQHEHLLRNLLGPFVLIVPALLGAFWGAPLVARELETGTFQLAWTQSVSRNRWLVIKLGVVGAASMAAAGVLSLLTTWWFSPIDKVNANRFATSVYEARDLVPIGYAAFAFALGAAAGVALRRTLPAMGATLAIFLVVRLALVFWVLPQLVAPVHASMPFADAGKSIGFSLDAAGVTPVAQAPNIANAWMLSSKIVDAGGHVASPDMLRQFVATNCPNVANTPRPSAAGGRSPVNRADFDACVTQLSATYHLDVAYQPAKRYWTFQWIEFGLYLGLAVVLAGGSLWWVRRRLT